MNFWVAIYLRGGGDEETRFNTLGEAKHVERTHERGLDGLDSIELIVRRRGRAGEVVDFYH